METGDRGRDADRRIDACPMQHVAQALGSPAARDQAHAFFVRDAVRVKGGPFARENPALPYLVVGLEPPTAADVASPDRRTEVRVLALALGESYGARMPYARRLEFINEDESLAHAVATHRAVIATLVPQLVSAEQQGNRAAFDRLAGEAVAEWQLLRAVYESMAPTSETLTQLKREHGMALGTETRHPHGH